MVSIESLRKYTDAFDFEKFETALEQLVVDQLLTAALGGQKAIGLYELVNPSADGHTDEGSSEFGRLIEPVSDNVHLLKCLRRVVDRYEQNGYHAGTARGWGGLWEFTVSWE